MPKEWFGKYYAVTRKAFKQTTKKVRCVILRNEIPAIPHGQVESINCTNSAGKNLPDESECMFLLEKQKKNLSSRWAPTSYTCSCNLINGLLNGELALKPLWVELFHPTSNWFLGRPCSCSCLFFLLGATMACRPHWFASIYIYLQKQIWLQKTGCVYISWKQKNKNISPNWSMGRI